MNLTGGSDLNSDFDVNNDFNRKIHVRIQQRNAKKYITIVEGISFLNLNLENMNLLLKKFKKRYGCGGSVEKGSEEVLVIQLTGDKREEMKQFLIEQGLATPNQILVHGF